MEDYQILIILEVIIYFVILIKVFFVLFALLYRVSLKRGSDKSSMFLEWKKRIDFLYVVVMSLILVYIFYPWNENTRFLTRKMCHLIFLYGIISIITSQWSDLT